MQLQEWQKEYIEQMKQGQKILIHSPRRMGQKSFCEYLKKYHSDLYNKYFYANTN